MYLDQYAQSILARRIALFREFSEPVAITGSPLQGHIVPLTPRGFGAAHGVVRAWVRTEDGLSVADCVDLTAPLSASAARDSLLRLVSAATVPAGWPERDRERSGLMVRIAREHARALSEG